MLGKLNTRAASDVDKMASVAGEGTADGCFPSPATICDESLTQAAAALSLAGGPPALQF